MQSILAQKHMVEAIKYSLADQFAEIAAISHGPVEKADHGVRFHALLDGATYKSIAYFIDDAVVLHIPINTEVKRERAIDTVLLLNYLNLSIPFGNYELIERSDVVEVRYKIGIFSGGEILRAEDFYSAMTWAGFFVKKFRGAIEAVAAGYAEVLSVIEKLEAE